VCQFKDHSKRQSRADHDFRFHGIAMLAYINAHELASCNSDSCSLGGNLGSARSLRVGPIDRRPLRIASQFSGQAFGRADRDSHKASGATKVIRRLAFESDRGWNFLRKSLIYNAQIHGADAVWLKSSKTRREVSLQHLPPRVDLYPVSRRTKDGKIDTRWAPYMRPEPPRRWVSDLIAIDARMIVFNK